MKTGAQGNRQDLVSGNAMTPAIYRMGPWAPASAGVTDKGAGVTRRGGDKGGREVGTTGAEAVLAKATEQGS